MERRRAVESPAVRALRDGVIVGLANHTLLIAEDGTERSIDDSAAPIRNAAGDVAGVVLVFRDVTERKRLEREGRDALAYAQEIISTLREPFLVLDKSLTVRTANDSFYETFRVPKEETEGRSLYELGDDQWDITDLRMLLDAVTREKSVHDFEVEHDFPSIGPRSMLLNARRFPPEATDPDLILLAIEDVTDRRRSELALKLSELRYRRPGRLPRDSIMLHDLGPSGYLSDGGATRRPS